MHANTSSLLLLLSPKKGRRADAATLSLFVFRLREKISAR